MNGLNGVSTSKKEEGKKTEKKKQTEVLGPSL